MNIFGEPRERKYPIKTMATAEEKRKIEAAAKKSDMSVAEFLRTAINDYIERQEKKKKSKKTR